jgi:hypothetical protein
MIYPWWQTGFYFYDPATLAPGQRFYFRKRQRSADAYYQGNDQVFVNNQPWPVRIDELRFFQLFGTRAVTTNYSTFDAFGVRMRASRDGEVVNNFMPISSLNFCERMRFEPAVMRRGGKMTLPQPFYLDGSENFSFRVFPGGTGVASIAGIQLGMLGFYPQNQAPVVRTAVPLTVTAGQAPTDYVLDAGRDKNVRAISVEELSFSVSGGSTELSAFWEVELEISPPRGPKWTDDVSTHLGFLCDQLPGWTYRKGAVVMTPSTPWTVLPGGNFMIEGLTLPTCTQVVADLSASGWIAAMAFGHQEVPDDYNR